MQKKTSTAYVWFDTEFTSLDLDEALLLQVSVMLTDKDLKRLTPPEEDVNFYIRADEKEKLKQYAEQIAPRHLKVAQSEVIRYMVETFDLERAKKDFFKVKDNK